MYVLTYAYGGGGGRREGGGREEEEGGGREEGGGNVYYSVSVSVCTYICVWGRRREEAMCIIV